MRDIGDLNWLNDYVGLPYKFGGRDYDGVDCYGLTKLIYAEEYGVELPDWLGSRIDLKGRADEIAGIVTSGDFVATEDPQDGDFAVCHRTKAAFHIGLFYGGGIIHAADGIGAIYVQKDRFEMDYVKVVYGAWTP